MKDLEKFEFTLLTRDNQLKTGSIDAANYFYAIDQLLTDYGAGIDIKKLASKSKPDLKVVK